MSTSALCETLDRLTSDERFFASAYLHHLAQAEDETWRLEMAATQSDMDAGRKFTLEQVRGLHEALSARGV